MLIQDYKRLFESNSEVKAIYLKGQKVWPAIHLNGPNYAEPFYVQNISNANETLSIIKTDNAPALIIEYSTNKFTWNTLGITSTTALTRTLQPGDKIYLRCDTNAWTGSNPQKRNAIYGISKVGGNIMSLLYGENFTGEETTFPTSSYYPLSYLFDWTGSKIIDASKLLLPATVRDGYLGLFNNVTTLKLAPKFLSNTLAPFCYSRMFDGCTSLTSAPELPATTLAERCYNAMFRGCTSLTSAPVLPATTLADDCYSEMFNGCISLTTAPALPATTLSPCCYQYMFRNCRSLTKAPELNANILVTACYRSLFDGCRLLKNVKCLATDISASYCLDEWMYNVSSTGIFTKATGVTWPTGISGIPSGWTVVEQ